MRIWFNRGYSLAPIAAAMVAAEPTIDVLISAGPTMPRYPRADVIVEERGLTLSDYTVWVADMIVKHQIDILVPTRHRVALMAADLPCRLVAPAEPAVLTLLADKLSFANALVGRPYHLATTGIATSRALACRLAVLQSEHDDEVIACIKPRRGVNGHGYWTLNRTDPMSHLIDPEGRNIRSDIYLGAIEAQEAIGPIDELVLMEYLPGPEISFDVLADDGTVLKSVARTKHAIGRQLIQSEHALNPSVADLIATFQLSGIINVQFRRAGDGSWKVLEINARPAGGIVYAEKAGAGILGDWARLLAGTTTPDQIKQPRIEAEIQVSSSIDLIG